MLYIKLFYMLVHASWYVYFLLCMLFGTLLFGSYGFGIELPDESIFLLFTVLLAPVVDTIFQFLGKEKLLRADAFDFDRYFFPYIAVAGIVFSIGYAGYDYVSIFLWAYMLFGIVAGINPKTAFLGALILFFYIPICLILEKDALAETLSIYAYYFLIIGVVLHISESVFPKLQKL